MNFMDSQVQETGAPVSYVRTPNIEKPSQRWLQYQTQQHCPINNYKTSSERTVPELRYFVFFVHRWFVVSLLLRDCRSAHCDTDSWSLKPRMRAPTELTQVTSDSFWWAFLCSSCGDKGSTAHISNQLLSNSWTIPQDSHLPWLQVLLLFDLNEEKISFCSPTLPLPWKSCTVQNLPELLSISALFSQHSYRHVLISTRDVSGLQVHS